MKTSTRAGILTTVGALAFGPLASMAAMPAANADDHDSTIQIVGGRLSSAPYSWMGENGGCGAALIAPRWIVTAAHCMTPYKIRLNSLNRWEGGENIEYSRLIRHPKYTKGDKAEQGYDIALVELSQASKGTPIPIAANAPIGSRSMILGWGATTPDGNGSTSLLKELDVSVLPNVRCNGVDGDARGGMELCTDNPGGNSGACFGDSGGPQVMKVNGRWELIGVTSRGPEVCASAPSIYTSVPFHAKWINETTNGAVPMPPGWKEIPADPGNGGPAPTPTTTPTAGPTSTPTSKPTNTPTSKPTTPGDNDGVDAEFKNNADVALGRLTGSSKVDVTRSSASSVKVSINISHPCSKDLEISIIPPSGRRTIIKRATTYGTCVAWNGTQSDEFKMSTDPRGAWTLEVTDRGAGAKGTLRGWGLTFR